MIRRGDLTKFRERRRPRGRRLPAESAWGVLADLSGVEPVWLARSSRYRLRRRSRDPEWLVSALEQSEPRADVHEWHLLPADVRRILNEQPGVPTGAVVAPEFSSLVPAHRLEYDAYVDRRGLDRLAKRFRPVPGAPRQKRNVTFRVPTNPWILKAPVAPPAVVAADLLVHPSERVRRTGRELLEELSNRD